MLTIQKHGKCAMIIPVCDGRVGAPSALRMRRHHSAPCVFENASSTSAFSSCCTSEHAAFCPAAMDRPGMTCGSAATCDHHLALVEYFECPSLGWWHLWNVRVNIRRSGTSEATHRPLSPGAVSHPHQSGSQEGFHLEALARSNPQRCTRLEVLSTSRQTPPL